MVNWKLSAVLGGIALILSLAVGLVSGAHFPLVLIRAIIFAIVFFALGAGLSLLIRQFIPELVSGGADEGESGSTGPRPGSHIDITLEDKALPAVFKALDTSEDVGDIGELINGTFKPPEVPGGISDSGVYGQGVDQISEDGYTGNRSRNGQSSADSQAGMPDFDVLAGSFLGKSGEIEGADGDIPVNSIPEPVRKPAGNRAQPMKGDFNPEELAAGIRTILSEDE
ncbi:MAG: hypothetical protein FWF29_01775 [Treponema sp.]|nr:hypothetical protein [Treponema sp.]